MHYTTYRARFFCTILMSLLEMCSNIGPSYKEKSVSDGDGRAISPTFVMKSVTGTLAWHAGDKSCVAQYGALQSIHYLYGNTHLDLSFNYVVSCSAHAVHPFNFNSVLNILQAISPLASRLLGSNVLAGLGLEFCQLTAL